MIIGGYGSNGTIMVMVRAAFDMSNLNFQRE